MKAERLRRWAGSVPLVPVALAVIAAVVVADVFSGSVVLHGLWAALFLGGIGAVLRPPLRLTGLACLMAAGIGASHDARLTTQRKIFGRTGSEVTIEGRVVETPRPGRSGSSCLIALDRFENDRLGIGGAVRAEGVPDSLRLGDRVRLSGLLERLPATRNPGEFDFAGWLHRQGADTALRVHGKVEPLGRTLSGRVRGFFERSRTWMSGAITRGLEPTSREAAVIRAVTLGERPRDHDDVVEQFRSSGTLHVFAVSGLHVGMVGALLWGVLRWTPIPRRGAIAVMIGGMFFYAALTGLRPPALRAALMAMVFFGGFLLRRRPQLLNTLAASLVAVLIWDTHPLFTVGFQLSYGVLATIALFSAPVARRLEFLARPEPYLPRVLMSRWQETWLRRRSRLVSLTGMSAAAWLGSIPLVAVHFATATPMAVVASIVVTLVVWAVLALGLLAGLVALAWEPAAVPVNRINGWMANRLVWTAGGFASVPGGHFRWGNGPAAHVTIFDLPRGGAAAHLNFGGGTLLDAGNAGDFQWVVKPAIRWLNLPVDTVVASHPDGRHIGGMAAAVEAFVPRQAMLPVRWARSPSYREFQAVVPGAIFPRQAGERYQLGDGATLEVLHVPPEEERHARADDRVLILRLERDGWRILFTADAGARLERRLVQSGLDLRADIWVAGRHDSGGTGTDAFLAAVAPQVIVTDHEAFPEGQSLPPTWENWVTQKGIRLLRQDRTGAVTIAWENGGLSLRGFLDGSLIQLDQPSVGRR